MPAGPAFLNECVDRPGFISASECTTLFGPGANTFFVDIPSDPFDAVAARENPPGASARQFRVGCTTVCTGSVGTIVFPDPPTGITDGEEHPGGAGPDPAP